MGTKDTHSNASHGKGSSENSGALSPDTHEDSVRTKILGLNRIIGGWCRYYQTTSSPSYYFVKLSHEVFWLMAHWLGRKYQMSYTRGDESVQKGKYPRDGIIYPG